MSYAQAADQYIEERASKACAGWGNTTNKSQGAVTIDNLSIKGDGQGTITVYRDGVDLGHFSSGTFDQYHKCLIEVIKLISPNQPAAADVTPAIPDYTTDWVEGGHSTATYCIPLLKSYQEKYPNFNIVMTPLAEDARWVGIRHRQYKYSCSFAAKPK